VDAYTERLKGVLGGGGTGAAYGLARAGNGSLRPIPSPAPLQAPTPSSVPPATGLMRSPAGIARFLSLDGPVSCSLHLHCEKFRRICGQEPYLR
jgi:hypothetical protein